MKKMNTWENVIKEGNVYHWDTAKMLTSLHKGTETVKVLSIGENSDTSTPLALLKSIQTGEEFQADIGHLQQDPEILKKKWKNLLKYFKRTGVKPKNLVRLRDDFHALKKNTRPWEIERFGYMEQEVLLLYIHGVWAEVVDQNGLVHTLHLPWIPELKAYHDPNIQAQVDHQNEMYMEFYDDDHHYEDDHDDYDHWDEAI